MLPRDVNSKDSSKAEPQSEDSFRIAAPSMSLPKGGGAIRGMGEKFAANPVTGTGSLSVPIGASPGRGGFGPQLSLTYDSGRGNGPFGLGWSLALPSITRKTSKGLPQYDDARESDIFILSGSEDLVPSLVAENGGWTREVLPPRTVYGQQYIIRRYRPRVEALFSRIERWASTSDPQDTFWRSVSKDNHTSWYGKDPESRIADPEDPSRIFTWLLCESYDDKGSVIVYRYKAEDSAGVDITLSQERNRTDASRSPGRYLKHVYYGNRIPCFPDLSGPAAVALPTDWCFQLVLDYGEHDLLNPIPEDAGTWTCRLDPFSTYNATFEVRTYCLCRRVLMFHHFLQEDNIGLNCLVRSTDFTHTPPSPQVDPTQPFYSYLLSAQQTSYRRKAEGGYLAKSLPPLEFQYTTAVVDETVREVDSESLQNLPQGLDGSRYRWVDLDSEGVSGILTEQDGGWFYKPNLSPANTQTSNGVALTLPNFGAVRVVSPQPSLAALSAGQQQFLSLAGDGNLDLVDFHPPTPGYFKRTADADWEPFKEFPSLPVLDWHNPNLKFIDLTGDSFSDLLISEDEAFWWHTSLGADGFGPAQRVSQFLDEEKGPRLIFADGTDSIFLADMSGDGLTDLVRIRNGEVCYWPNLGYGRFGVKVAMDQAPWFDRPELFDGRHIQLADIDGSGTSDILYFTGNQVHLYFNQSGNAWGARRTLDHYPSVDSLSTATIVDLLGNGTACLVWSSGLPGNSQRPMRYIDLMGGQKPHLLVRVTNNLGAETVVQYAPSTKFYVADKLNGTPWVTRLPFPVHVVEQVQTYDYTSRNLFVTRYTYHHGYFDGVERDFRGFGRVDQYDTGAFGSLTLAGDFPQASNLDAASSVPPVLTKTWFHTGAFFGGDRISRQFEDEYYREGDPSGANPGLTPPQSKSMLLPDTTLPTTVLLPDGSRVPYSMSGEEMREACRALHGSILRQEVYAEDGSDSSDRPYSVSERDYTLEVYQPCGPNPFGIHIAHARETIDFHYERMLYSAVGNSLVAPGTPGERTVADPSVTHAFTLTVDVFGNILQSAAISYGRRYLDPSLTAADQAKQQATHATYSEASFTNSVILTDVYRTPLPSQTSFYELLQVQPFGALPDATNLLSFDQLAQSIGSASDGAHEIAFENLSPSGLNPGQPYRRMLKCERTLYRPDDLGLSVGDTVALLPLGTLENLALPGIGYKQAFTQGLVSQVYRRAGGALLPQPAAVLESTAPDGGGYVNIDGNWWISSGRIYYLPVLASPAQEDIEARANFYLPRRFEDPFGNATSVDYDKPHNIFPVKATDAASSTTIAAHDYRVLQPSLLTDPNGNRTAASFDVLGLVAGVAVMGKTSESLGDSFSTFAADLSQQEIDDFYDDPDPHALGPGLLGTATRRIVYDVDRFLTSRLATPNDPSQWQPPFAATLARETHVSDPVPPGGLQTQISFSYSDGFGREIQHKHQAEPGPVVPQGPSVTPRWIASGWTIFNNKAKPVRQYEPFFSQLLKGHEFEFGVQAGVSPILFYDPIPRVVGTLHPDHSWEKIVFDPWRQEFWDGNDTVLIADPRTDLHVGGYFRRLPDADYLPTWSAQRPGSPEAVKTAIHAATPRFDYADSLGHTFLTIADNKFQRSNEATPTEEFYATHVSFDVEGHQREVTDPLDRVVMRYNYDMLGKLIHEASMEAGERWTLDDIAEKPIRTWDTRGDQFRTEYDMLRRPTQVFLQDNNAPEIQIGKTVYGDSLANPEVQNQRGRIVQIFDQAGVVITQDYDFKGNQLTSSRQLATQYKATLDWSGNVPLESGSYTSSMTYDALNRATEQTTPDGSQVRQIFNQGNLLERIEGNLQGEAGVTHFVTNIDYDAKGLRTSIEYGNGAKTTCEYDAFTFLLTRLRTTRDAALFAGDCVQPPVAGWPGCGLQDLNYTYDPVGNVMRIRDDAQQAIYFQNKRVEPSSEYIYDAVYRLIEASGREHLGQNAGIPNAPGAPDPFDSLHTHLPQPGDGIAMGRYTERYVYDGAAKFLSLQHTGSDPANPGWIRVYNYSEQSQLEPAKWNNRLSSTTIGPITEKYRYDGAAGLHGDVTSMPHLPLMQWDFHDQLQATSRQAVGDAAREITWYVYDHAGQRVRKVTELANGAKKEKRLYLFGFEVYRKYAADGATVNLERESVHVMDGQHRMALVENRTKGNDGSLIRLIRFQFGNHLGSASLELDEWANIISYEEYLPYGGTAYQSVDGSREIPAKRYRFTAMERDEESGLEYHSTRYYAPWLGRWCSPDSIGIRGGINLYEYTSNPVTHLDATGEAPKKAQPEQQTKKHKNEANKKKSHDGAHKPKKTQQTDTEDRKKKQTKPPTPAAIHNHQKILVILEPKDTSHDFDPHIKPAKANGYKVLQVKSGKDLLAQLKAVSQQGSIAILSFANHGIPEGIGGRTDGGRTGMYVNDKVPNFNSSKAITAQDLINSVKNGDIKLDPNAKVILGGCRGLGGDDASGVRWQGSRADAIASKLAAGLGVPVIASFGRTTASPQTGDTTNRHSTGQYEWVDPAGASTGVTTKLPSTINIVPKKLNSKSDLSP